MVYSGAVRAHPIVLGALLAGCALASGLVGCAPSADQIQADFDEHVAARGACTVDADCAVISPGCPLGCFVAVRADAAEECEAYARELIASYERGGSRCAYDCVVPGPPRCEAGSCRVDPAL